MDGLYLTDYKLRSVVAIVSVLSKATTFSLVMIPTSSLVYLSTTGKCLREYAWNSLMQFHMVVLEVTTFGSSTINLVRLMIACGFSSTISFLTLMSLIDDLKVSVKEVQLNGVSM